MYLRSTVYKKTKRRNVFLFFCFFVFLIGADRWSKIFFINNPDYVRDFLLFKLDFVLNSNMAFNIVIPQIIIFFLVGIVLALLVYLLVKNYRSRNFGLVCVISLIMIGALSNILDRVQFGGVIDFIDVPYFSVFNLSDIYITLGVANWLWLERKNEPRRVR